MHFTSILTHERPHLDEIVAIWLLRKFGEQRFPGISTASVTFTSIRKLAEAGLKPEDYEARGVLLLGIGGGRFDEHPTLVEGRKAGDCATTLVAKELGVSDDPSLTKILRFVRAADVEGNASPFDVSYVVKLLHARYPDDPHRVIEWALVAIEAKYQEQLRFFTVVKPEFDAKAKVEEIAVGQRRLRVVTIDSDEDGIHKYARSEYGARAAVVIQRRSSGNVAIFGNKQAGVDLREAAKLVRLAEREASRTGAGGEGPGTSPVTRTPDPNPQPLVPGSPEDERLTAEGYAPGAEEWFYHKQGQMLLNGSLTQADVPATRLSLDRISELVKIGIDAGRVKPLCESTGQCLGDVCDWYTWSLARCVKLRRPAPDAASAFSPPRAALLRPGFRIIRGSAAISHRSRGASRCVRKTPGVQDPVHDAPAPLLFLTPTRFLAITSRA